MKKIVKNAMEDPNYMESIHSPMSSSFFSLSFGTPTTPGFPGLPALPSDKPLIKSGPLNFVDLDPDDFALVLAADEKENINRLTIKCFVLHLWESHKDPNIIAQLTPINDLVDKFNRISFWVATEICTQPGIIYITQK
jgi:hypothetical protein